VDVDVDVGEGVGVDVDVGEGVGVGVVGHTGCPGFKLQKFSLCFFISSDDSNSSVHKLRGSSGV